MTWPRAALLTLVVVAIPLGYAAATHPIDVAIYRDIGAQVLRHDYQLYSDNAGVGFRYAPIVAFMCVPLALVPLWMAALLIYALKLVALAGTALVVAKLAGLGRTAAAKIGLLAFLVAGGYLLEEFRTGNVHFVVLGAIVAGMYLAERGSIALPSFLFALAAAVKISPLIFVGFFLATRRFKLAAGTIAALLIVFMLPAALLGPTRNTELVKGFVVSASQRPEETRNHSLKGVLARFLSDSGPDAGLLPAVNAASLSKRSVDVAWYAIDVALLAALGWVLLIAPRGRHTAPVEYALVTTAMLVVSPHSLRIYFATLYFPACVLLAALMKRPDHPRRRLISTVLIATGVLGTLAPLVPGRRWSMLYEALSPHFVVAVLVAGCLALMLHTPRTIVTE